MADSETRKYIKDVSLGLMSIDVVVVTIGVNIEYAASGKPYIGTVVLSLVCLLLSAVFAAMDLVLLTNVVLEGSTASGGHGVREMRSLLAAGLLLFMVGLVLLEASLVYAGGYKLIPLTLLLFS